MTEINMEATLDLLKALNVEKNATLLQPIVKAQIIHATQNNGSLYQINQNIVEI